MWSSDTPARPNRRALLAFLALGACNLRPIYSREEAKVVVPDLAAIQIGQLGGRRDQYVRNYLLDEFNPEGVVVPPQYQLDLVMQQESNALAIQLDDTATRVNLILGANFTLKRIADGQVLYSSATRRVVSYNIRTDPFSTLISGQDAERRGAHEIARQIRTILSLYFAEHAG